MLILKGLLEVDLLEGREIQMIPMVILSLNHQDQKYMELIYFEHHRLMLSTAWRYFKEASIIDDIVSDSCVALMKKIDVLKSLDNNELRLYIVSTVRNTALNYHTRTKRISSHIANVDKEVMESVADGQSVEGRIVLEDEIEMVWRAIQQLPLKEQKIMKLKYLLGYTDDVTAKEVGISANSIAKYVSRARKKLAAMIYSK